MSATPLDAPRPDGPRRPDHPVRFVTAASLFDGHDASINVMRRVLQRSGAEVVHLGHDRSVGEVVSAAIEEDAQAIAISSYQGGHLEYFKYARDLLDERGASHVKIFGGGGGVITPPEIAELEAYGVDKIFSPEDGRRLGLQGMIDQMIEAADYDPVAIGRPEPAAIRAGRPGPIARAITMAETGRAGELRLPTPAEVAPVLGVTGTGGAGKSSLTDELLRRHLLARSASRVAVLSIDPSRKRSGGALLGDRIRMNAIDTERVFMRSLSSRGAAGGLSAALGDAIRICQAAGFDLVIVETSGIGQGDASIVEHCDLSLYVMTSEFGASSQLEKIDMLDFADLVALNKFEKGGSQDALRAVRKQVRRNRQIGYEIADEALPVFGTIASQFNDDGVSALYAAIAARLHLTEGAARTFAASGPISTRRNVVIPADRVRYLSEAASACRAYRRRAEELAERASRIQALERAARAVPEAADALEAAAKEEREGLPAEARALIEEWPSLRERYAADELSVRIGERSVQVPLTTTSLSGTRVPRVSLPRLRDAGDILSWRMRENVPGQFPFTAGVFPLKRADEEPKRMFAGEGTPDRTNRRFHYLCKGERFHRLSTAFDSVTLYGQDPDERPDIYGKIGNSGVSICTLDDMKRLYAGFDLAAPTTSVSMTINGPAPIILAMYLNTAIDQQLEAFASREGRAPREEEAEGIADRTLSTVRGTVQADILKEDQAQNTCIFSTDFALKMMGDIQEFFVEKGVRNYYSVSISGYHIAEAGANPITQLALTLANGLTYVEYYLARGMKIDDFARNLSFFFSNGMDPEYTVLGRVARRIWAVAMRERYGASGRSQKLKYHIQTSGRSLHAQEIDFNDIRTTLQALIALFDNCNSLHTNAYDEAITTPTEASVRRAMAIQMIINREFGLSKSDNPLQGSHVVDDLTDLVEEAVLAEFDSLTERGGVLGAMERQYQRSKIQDESIQYELKKHSGELPIIGVNTFLAESDDEEQAPLELIRSTEEEKQTQLRNLRAFQAEHAEQAPAALERLRQVALADDNVFAELMRTVRSASLGQISGALFEVGGQYRRSM